MTIIEIGRMHVRSIPDGSAIPAGWAELVGALELDSDGTITSVPITDPPYHRSRTQADIDAAAAQAVLDRRAAARAHLRALLKDAQLTRAQMAVVVDEFNRHTDRYDSLRDAVIALATAITAGANLTAIKTAVGLITTPLAALAPRTDEDLMTAAENILDTDRVD